MTFRRAVVACFQDYATFRGRASRSEFWWFFVFVVLASMFFEAIDQIAFGRNRLLGLSGLFTLFTFVPQLAVSWRRLHDTGRPGWMNLLPALPLVLILSIGAKPSADLHPLVVGLLLFVWAALTITVLVWLILPGRDEPNRFGVAAKP